MTTIDAITRLRQLYPWPAAEPNVKPDPRGWCAGENWPRFVLEAMAAGVPVITDNRGGTREMIEHGVTGYLCDTPADATRYATHLADHEAERIVIARNARAAVERLADPDAIWAGWQKLFSE